MSSKSLMTRAVRHGRTIGLRGEGGREGGREGEEEGLFFLSGGEEEAVKGVPSLPPPQPNSSTVVPVHPKTIPRPLSLPPSLPPSFLPFLPPFLVLG